VIKMTYNPYSNQALTFEQEQAMRQIANNVYAEKKMTTVNYNPETDTYHKALNPHSETFDWKNDPQITKPGEWSKAKQGLTGASSSTERDHYTYQPFRDEFAPMAVEFNEMINKALTGGGTISTQDYPLMTDTVVDSTMYDIVVRNFNLLPAVTRKAWGKLTYTADDRTPYRNTFNMGEFDVAPSTSISYATTTINLKKAQGHVSISRWVDLAIRRHDIRGDNESIIDADFERGFTADLLTTLGGFTDDAVAGVYDTLTTEHNTNNPFADFYTDQTTIRTAGGTANILVMNSQTYYTLANNTWMRVSGTSVIAPGVAIQPAGSMGPITHPALPGYQIFIEETIAKGTIFIMDKRAALFLDGPRSTRTVEDNMHNVVDTLSDYWYGSGLRVSTWGIEMTGSVT
jgi:hypothetical protein